ncbi:MAG: ABC transporter substrate-binding protein [Saccharospirillaceae bacterium]|nr:ABC transporter substrate-binding protein [Saccharospirillaceae bacterium]MCD8532504.1 ABC transporter substrate-binding protein [Saccharospirillaceae bacterium]
MRWLLVLLSLTLGSVVYAADSEELAEQAHEVVKRTTEKVMASINKNRSIYESDKAQFFWELEDVLGPMVDFQRLTRRIMGRYYREATLEQRKRFASAFKRSLLSSYATGLIEFNDYEVRVLPPKAGVENTLRNTLVDLEVVTPSGRVFPITQSMYFHHRDRRWMAQNVIVNGINVGKLFGEQFEQMVQENDGNIGAAIDDWIETLQEQGRKLRKKAPGA